MKNRLTKGLVGLWVFKKSKPVQILPKALTMTVTIDPKKYVLLVYARDSLPTELLERHRWAAK